MAIQHPEMVIAFTAIPKFCKFSKPQNVYHLNKLYTKCVQSLRIQAINSLSYRTPKPNANTLAVSCIGYLRKINNFTSFEMKYG